MDSSRPSAGTDGGRRRGSAFARGLSAALLLCGLAAAGHAQDGGTLRVQWAMLQRSADGTTRSIDSTRDPVALRAGDRIRLWMKPLTDGWYYLFLHDAQKRLTLLSPTDLGTEEGPVAAGTGWFVPGPQAWFRLDASPGTEVLYLILSDRRLSVLESAAVGGAGKARPGAASRPVERPSETLDEIRRLVVQSSSLVRPAETPVPVAGDFRGLEVESGFDGILIEARGLYVRTFRLEH
jgi:hypothetical protein